MAIEQEFSTVESENGYNEAIVILGGGLQEGYKDSLRTPWETRLRVLAAVDYYCNCISNNNSPVIIISGGLKKDKDGVAYTEASVMKKELMNDYSIPEDRIIIDEESFDTATNAEEVSQRLADLGFGEKQRVTLITNVYHLNRAERLFKKRYGFPKSIHGIGAEEYIIHDGEEKFDISKKPTMHPYREYAEGVFAERFLESSYYKFIMLRESVLDKISKIPVGQRILTNQAKKNRG